MFIISYADIIGTLILGYYIPIFLFLFKFIKTNFYKTNLIEHILFSPPNFIEHLILTLKFH